MCISRIILYYCDILIFYITVAFYLFVRGYKCRSNVGFPTRFAHAVSSLCYCHCSALMSWFCYKQVNKHHIISYHIINMHDSQSAADQRRCCIRGSVSSVFLRTWHRNDTLTCDRTATACLPTNTRHIRYMGQPNTHRHHDYHTYIYNIEFLDFKENISSTVSKRYPKF